MAQQQTIPTSLTPEVFIDQVGGSLQVKGWERSEVEVRADPNVLRLEDQDDVIHVSCDADCEIRLPTGATLQIETVQGEAHIRSLSDQLEIQAVQGSLYIRNVAETRLETVFGEMNARQVSGDFRAERIMGSATLREIQGECLLDEVMGNLDLRDVEGDVQARCMGNARLRLDSLAGSRYELRAEGNIYCRLPQDANLKLNLSSRANSIMVKLPDGSKSYNQPEVEIILGNGAASMAFSAGGAINLSAYDEGMGDEEERAASSENYTRMAEDFSEQISQQIEAQIEAQMEAINRQIEQMTASATAYGGYGPSPEEIERITRQARERSEHAAAKAQEKMRRAQERMERKMEAARRREEQMKGRESGSFRHGHFGWHVNFPSPPAPPVPPAPPNAAVSEEERLMILRMLEQKKISLDEADQLLSALEGKES